MNDTSIHTGIDLDRYVAEVRGHLADLDPEVREDLTEGLAADLAELVEERGSAALRHPEEYAAELRAAAGLGVPARTSLLPAGWWHPAWEVAVAALPAWWVARAWGWVMVLHLLLLESGSEGYDVPWLPTSSVGLGLLLWGAASVVSIQMGRGRLWPEAGRGTAALVAVVLLNVGSGVAAVAAWDHMDQVLDSRAQGAGGDEAYDIQDVNPAVITYQNYQSCRLRVFDADGDRVRGARVEDQAGRVLPIRNSRC